MHPPETSSFEGSVFECGDEGETDRAIQRTKLQLGFRVQIRRDLSAGKEVRAMAAVALVTGSQQFWCWASIFSLSGPVVRSSDSDIRSANLPRPVVRALKDEWAVQRSFQNRHP